MPGYLLIDHSQGTGPDGRQGIKQEYDTKKCGHCQLIFRVYVKRRLFGEQGEPKCEDEFMCLTCMNPLCTRCVSKAVKNGCEPFMQKIEKRLQEQASRRRLDQALTTI